MWTISAFVIGVLVFFGISIYQATTQWTPLQRYWFPNYLKMQLAASLGFPPANYRLLEVEDRQGRHRLAVEADVAPWKGSLSHGTTIPLFISNQAARLDLRLVLEPPQKYKNKELSDYAQHWIYQDQTWGDFLHLPLIASAVVFAWLLIFVCSQRLAAATRAQVWAPDQRPSIRYGGAVQPQPAIRWHRLHHKRAAHGGGIPATA